MMPQKAPRWKPEEIAVLERLSGVKPFQKIVEAVQRLDKKNGWYVRSEAAVRSQIFLRGLSRDCTLDNLSARRLAKELDIEPARVLRWLRSGLPYKRNANRKLAISLADFRDWAEQNPERLTGIEFFRLAWALGDEDLASRLTQPAQAWRGKPRALQRVDTGQRFRSISRAAWASHIDRCTLSRAAREAIESKARRFEVFGIPWEVLDCA